MSRSLLSTLFFVFFFLLTCSWPHVFTYQVGAFLCIGIFGLIVLGSVFATSGGLGNPALQRAGRFVDRHFPLLMLCGITAFSLSALNQKLYSTVSEANSIYHGFFTLGGMIPLSDNHQYMSGVLNFLKFGELNGQANFRPLSHLFASVVYRLSGDDMVRFFHSFNVLLIASLWYHGLVVARHLGRYVALASVFLMCMFFVLFQGSFLTELPGGVVGTVAISLLLHGWFTRSIGAYVTGMCLSALAMHMRTGVVFLLPALVVLGGARFGHLFKKRSLAYVAMTLIMAAASLAPSLQYRLFRKEVKTATNFGEYAFKILKNSDHWPFSSVYPHKKVNGRTEGFDERMSRANADVAEKVTQDYDIFMGNYFSMMYRYLKRPQRFLTPFTEHLSAVPALIILLLFLSG